MLIPHLRIVLVDTSHPGNIGAAARAMKNMGVTELVLVTPQQFPHPEADARASGADDVLAAARVVATLDAALADCVLAIATTARTRHLSAPVLEPRAVAERAVATLVEGPVALVFGRERTGLTNAEIDRCNLLAHIPTNPGYSSLNLAAAVQVMCYEARLAWRAQQADAAAGGSARAEPLATAEELEALYAHYASALIRIGFLDPDKPRHLMRRLRCLYHRAALQRNEVALLRGILSAVEERKQPGSKCGPRPPRRGDGNS